VGWNLADGSYLIPVGPRSGRRELKWPTGIFLIPVVGRLDTGILSQPPMRPDHGYVSLVSVRPSFCSALCFLRL
jgi:hypothetical protein